MELGLGWSINVGMGEKGLTRLCVINLTNLSKS